MHHHFQRDDARARTALASAAPEHPALRSSRIAAAGLPLLLLLTALLLSSFAFAQNSAPAAPAEARQSRAVIERQLDAIQRDAWAEAFVFAGPGVQSMFQTPERFGAMVRGGYPMVWRPSSVDFLNARQNGEDVYHRLRVVDANGERFQLLYLMRLIDGAWKVEGVWAQKEEPLPTA